MPKRAGAKAPARAASADLRVRVVPVNGQAPCEVGASVICALAVIL